MTAQPQPHIEEFDHEALWNSCIDLAARLPLRVASLTLVGDCRKDNPVPTIDSYAEIYWAGGVKTDFAEFKALSDLSYPHPELTLTSLEFDIARSMGRLVVEPGKYSVTFTDTMFTASRHPELANSVARACLSHASNIEFGWLPDDPEDYDGDLSKPYYPRANHPSLVDTINDEKIWAGAWLQNIEHLTEIRRRLAPLVGETAAPYEADYAALRAACDRIAPRENAWPYNRNTPMSIADLKSLAWTKLS